jgi:hypothetical protein
VVLAIVLTAAVEVSAFQFELYYFETDQLQYHIGETMEMFARILADFSDMGWCYVSFSVVADSGTIYVDERMISPSPDVRYISSKYCIEPSDLFPGENGTKAYAIFNAELFDGYSETVTETIELNISRGQLDCKALSNLTFEENTNTTLYFQVVSRHNQSIAYADSDLLFILSDNNSNQVFKRYTNTNMSGIASTSIEQNLLSTGNYSLEILSNVTATWEPINETFDIEVVKERSYIQITSAEASAVCQSQSGKSYENMTIEAQHLNRQQNTIGDGFVEWNTPFCSGTTAIESNGEFLIEIPIKANPGIYNLDITASHSNYQPAMISMPLNITRRSMLSNSIVYTALSPNPINGSIQLYDSYSCEELTNIDVEIKLVLNSTEFKYYGETNENGELYWQITVPSTLWGSGYLIVEVNSTTCYHSFSTTTPINIEYIPQIIVEEPQIALLGNDCNISVQLLDSINVPLKGIDAKLTDNNGLIIDYGVTDSLGKLYLSWNIPNDTKLGEIELIVHVSPCPDKFVYETLKNFTVTIYNPIWIFTDSTPWYLMRGETSKVNITLQSPIVSANVTLHIAEAHGLFALDRLLTCNKKEELEFDIQSQLDVGHYFAELRIEDQYSFIKSTNIIQVVIQGKFRSNVTILSAFYNEQISANISIIQDNGTKLNEIDIQLLDATDNTLLANGQQVNLQESVVLMLPPSLFPGSNIIILKFSRPFYEEDIHHSTIFVWMRTTVNFSIMVENNESFSMSLSCNPSETLPLATHNNDSIISLGSIGLPPPILVNDKTSNESSTTLSTSRPNCPRLNSGISNLSTPFENSITAFSGKGQSVLSCMPFMVKSLLESIMACSAEREVLPKEIMAKSALLWPTYLGSGNPVAAVIFSFKRRTNLS